MAVLEGREGIWYQKSEESLFNVLPLLVCEDLGLMDNFFTTFFFFPSMDWDDNLKNKSDSIRKTAHLHL